MSLVLLLHVAHHEVPRVVLVVRHLEARDPRDHVVVDRQDHLPVQVDERDLQSIEGRNRAHTVCKVTRYKLKLATEKPFHFIAGPNGAFNEESFSRLKILLL